MPPLRIRPPSSDEIELRKLLALPIEKRAAVSAMFAGVVWRLLTSQESYVRRLASGWVRPHEAEDIAADVIFKAAEDLKEQFASPSNRRQPNGSKKLDWNSETTPFAILFRNFCGYPFKRQRSGVITNSIRKVWQTCRHVHYDPDQESNSIDESMADPEQKVIGAEDERTEKFQLQRLDFELKRMDRNHPRASFMLRLSYGIHSFEQLDAEALVLLAKELRLTRVEVALVKEIASGFEFELGQKSLSNNQIGSLTSVRESGVRYQLTKAKNGLLQSMKTRAHLA